MQEIIKAKDVKQIGTREELINSTPDFLPGCKILSRTALYVMYEKQVSVYVDQESLEETRTERKPMININKPAGSRWIELGGGETGVPWCDVNVDVRKVNGVHFEVNFEEYPWPISTGEFDGVYSSFCLEHISWRNVPQYLTECFRILKPEGNLILVLPNTEAQLKWILSKGWEKRPQHDGHFIEASRILYGDQDYSANAHRSFFSPQLITELLQKVGFGPTITVRPFGDIQTDMVVEAVKSVQKPVESTQAVTLQSVVPQQSPPPVPSYSGPNRDDLTSEERSKLFNREYFDNHRGTGFYWDYPQNEIVTRHVLARNPQSVVELGCGRGYVLKRLQDRGVDCRGADISEHCLKTAAIAEILDWDFLEEETLPRGPFDLCFSLNFLQYVPEKCLPRLIEMLSKETSRGLHGIDFHDKSNGADNRQCTFRPKEWWKERLPKTHEVFDRDELERGELPPEVLQGDGKVKLNLGCAWSCFHYGWENCDIFDNSQFCNQFRYKFRRLNLLDGLPMYGTETVDLIFMHHVLEHFNYVDGLRILKECRRVLKPDGAIRVAVPDAETLMSIYIDGGLNQYDEVNGGCAAAVKQAEKLHALLYHNHQSIYDLESLWNTMEKAGLDVHDSCFREFSNNENIEQIFRETTENNYGDMSLFANGFPK